MSDLDILVVGPYPPPFGGISAHVARLAEAIQADGLSVGILNHFRGRHDDPIIVGELRRDPFRYWRALRAAHPRIVHYHHARWSTLLATALALRHSSSASVATIHGQELGPFIRSRIPGVAQLTRRALDVFDVLIAVSVEVGQELEALVDAPVNVIPAYIPAHNDQATLSPSALAFLRGNVNLVVSAYRLTADRNGKTIYGLETAIRSFEAIALARPKVRLAIFLAEPPRSRRESDRLRRLIEDVDDDEVRARIGVFCGERLIPAFRMAVLYLRPTLVDGDAVSVREAMAAGVPVVASDVVARPEGVSTLPLDERRWTIAIEETLARRQCVNSVPAGRSHLDQLMDIYHRLERQSSRATAATVGS